MVSHRRYTSLEIGFRLRTRISYYWIDTVPLTTHESFKYKKRKTYLSTRCKGLVRTLIYFCTPIRIGRLISVFFINVRIGDFGENVRKSTQDKERRDTFSFRLLSDLPRTRDPLPLV